MGEFTLEEVGLAGAIFAEDEVAPGAELVCHVEAFVAGEGLNRHSFYAH